MTAIEKYLKQYLDYLELERHRSPKTIENYQRYLRRFLAWSEIEQPEQITADLAGNYQVHLASPSVAGVVSDAGRSYTLSGQGQVLRAATQYYHLIALRGFLQYLAKKNLIALSAENVSLGQPPSRQVAVLADEEVERLLNILPARDLAGFRNQAILEILFSTGLRVSELCRLNRTDFNQGQLNIASADKARLAYLSEPAKKVLATYLSKRQDDNPALFINLGRGRRQTRASRLTARSIQRIVKKYALLAGIEPQKVTPFALRHAFAFGLLRAGAEVKSLQRLLGHAHLSTTQVYTKLTGQNQSRA